MYRSLHVTMEWAMESWSCVIRYLMSITSHPQKCIHRSGACENIQCYRNWTKRTATEEIVSGVFHNGYWTYNDSLSRYMFHNRYIAVMKCTAHSMQPSLVHIHYFSSSEIYPPSGLGLGSRQVPVRITIAKEWVTQALGLGRIWNKTKSTI